MATTAELRDRAAKALPGGVNSNVRLGAPHVFFDRGRGARLWDIDGREYVDYLLGQGPAFLGHAHPDVLAAVAEAAGRGMVFGAQHELEVVAAERVLDALGWADSLRFGLTGTEAVHAAIRLARAVTGRRKVIRFAGQYHGWLDTVLMSFDGNTGQPGSAGQPAEYLADWVICPFNDLDATAAALAAHGDDVAAVILEPMMCNNGAIPPREGFLDGVRELCSASSTLLIFDEVITGFRLALGGAAQCFGVTPDIAVYGKALAGGWPVAAIAGRGDLMEGFGTGTVTHAGTFNGSTMAAAAVAATMDVLRRDPPYQRIAEHGRALMEGLTAIGRERGAPLHVQGLPAAFHVSFGDDAPVHDYAGLTALDLDRYASFSRTLCSGGLWVAGRGIWYVSAAHGPAELADALERFDSALARHLTAPDAGGGD